MWYSQKDQMTMRFACRITRATNTYSECLIPIAFAQWPRIRELSSTLPYTCTACSQSSNYHFLNSVNAQKSSVTLRFQSSSCFNHYSFVLRVKYGKHYWHLRGTSTSFFKIIIMIFWVSRRSATQRPQWIGTLRNTQPSSTSHLTPYNLISWSNAMK